MRIDYEKELNPQQWEAVSAVEGPVLVVAGAGSGKTRVITYKIAYLIDAGLAHPAEILAVTFTNKAAREMRERVEHLLQSLAAAPLVSTFHSFGVRVLRQHADRLGYPTDFTICDVDDQKRLLREILRETGLADPRLAVDRLRAAISWARNRGMGPKEYEQQSRSLDAPVVAEVFERYLQALRKRGAVDFDDLILLPTRLFREHPDLAQAYSRRYRYILVDEYQDTNRPQAELLRHLTCEHQNITAVGDEDQAIYGFRGAEIHNILSFEKTFRNARIIKLEQNYRSTANILKAAGAVVAKNRRRRPKELWTEAPDGDLITLFIADTPRREAEFVAREIAWWLSRGTSGVAVLYRTNFQSRQFEETLRSYGIPYRLVGTVSFYQRKEIRDALAYLRVIRNPDDDLSLLRILNEPPRGIGATTLATLQAYASSRDLPLWRALLQLLGAGVLGSRTEKNLAAFVELIQDLQAKRDLPLGELLDLALRRSGYWARLEEDGSEEAKDRLGNLKELLAIARDFQAEEDPWQALLDHASLHTELDEVDERAQVSLMTLHNAKGLEFPVVFLVGLEQGIFPHSRAMEGGEVEEERRLFYVGLTRAREKLYVSYSRRRAYGSNPGEMTTPSVFLDELPGELLEIRADGIQAPRSREAPVALRAAALQLGRYEPERHWQRVPGKRSTRPSHGTGRLPELPGETDRNYAQADEIRVGRLVRHPSFGVGRVLETQPAGKDTKVKIRFESGMIRSFLVSYARLQLL
ncbi:MAG: UvrD-helicase domain-containing protein [Acidobacteriota bacterium]